MDLRTKPRYIGPVKRLSAFILILLCAAGPLRAAPLSIKDITDRPHERLTIEGDWRYRLGDDLRWASPDLDDRDWQRGVSPGLTFRELHRRSWPAVSWFRLWIDADRDVLGKALHMAVIGTAALEIFVDGKRFATVADPEAVLAKRKQLRLGGYRQLGTLTLHKPRTLLAVRLVNPQISRVTRLGRPAGVKFSLTTDWGKIHQAKMEHFAERFTFLFVGAVLAIGLLHLFLFFFHRNRRENLEFALGSGAIALVAHMGGGLNDQPTLEEFVRINAVFNAAVVLAALFGLRTYFAMFNFECPRWLKTAFGAVAAALVVGCAWVPLVAVYGYALLTFSMQAVLLVMALRRRKSGAWIIAVGGIMMISLTIVTIIADMRMLWLPWTMAYMLGFLIHIDAMSFYLARSIAADRKALALELSRNEQLATQALEQQRAAHQAAVAREKLEAENAKKEIALAEAQKREEVLKQLEATNRQLRDAQAQLVQSQMMVAIGRLVAGIAHQMNTPLGAILSQADAIGLAIDKVEKALNIGSSDQLQRDKQLARPLSALRSAQEVVGSGSRQLAEAIRHLQSFARLDQAELKRISVQQSVDDALALITPQLGANITIKREFAELPPIACYPAQLNQALLNLLENAHQAVDAGGTISVTTGADGGYVYVAVHDDGRGIAPEHIKNIFEPGFTTRGVGVGAGLGLAICYRIVDRHCGEITVDSSPGKGATFTIRLPKDLERRLGQLGSTSN
ncbi:MAG: HAMP domain-containing histidine kinase [Deltaproteobacteria bacterium]|nr:HAMP domain-containing histidine kinase [Deltaproteobacteria bacterium]